MLITILNRSLLLDNNETALKKKHLAVTSRGGRFCVGSESQNYLFFSWLVYTRKQSGYGTVGRCGRFDLTSMNSF